MPEARQCPECRAQLPVDAPEGMCPHCLLQRGLMSASGGASTAAFVASSTAPPPEELARLFPQLEILELLGQGGMGAVYKARQPGLDRLVALKILPGEAGRDPTFTERFTREARALARLNHPNIVAVYDVGQTGGLCYFLMELVDGVNLRQVLQARQLPSPQALQLVPQICAALQYAHDEGIVHRDIKPENILLDRKGRVKIADFGLAKLLGQAPADARLTAPQQVMGTPHYMAPEQVEKPLEVDHRADIYSLGVVFYELLTGELPLGRFAPPSQKVHIDLRLDEVVLKTLEKEPQRRYQHISEVKTDIESITAHPSPRAVGPSSPTVPESAGYEYRSPLTLGGLPLVHITWGPDPATGGPRTARGILAIGDRGAIGVVALGGAYAIGSVAVGGGVGLGLIGIGGLGVGLLLAVGGLAVGGLAVGGGAVGAIALGGAAVGYYALGGGSWGVHAYGGNVQDPAALASFQSLADGARGNLSLLKSALIAVLLAGMIGLDHWIRTCRERWQSWWFDRSPFGRKAIECTLLLLALVGAALFLSYSATGTTEGGMEHNRTTIGLPDPWFTREQKGFSSSWLMRPLSWSFLAGVVAYLTVYVSLAINLSERRRRREESAAKGPV